jgi:fused signal recognition particle receptor
MAWFRRKDKSGTGPEEERRPAVQPPPASGQSDGSTIAPEAAESAGLPQGAPEAGAQAGYFSRLRQRLSKTRQSFSEGFDRILASREKVDAEVLEQLEELLITSDIGVKTSAALMERIASAKAADAGALRAILRQEILAILTQAPPRTGAPPTPPTPQVILVVGVNGVGKTTTIGKLAARFTASGKRVLIAAADTFRAAAAEQLTIWAERAGAGIVRHKEGTDPAAVAFDAVEAALARSAEVVIVDTAGRLHTKVNLMEEIKKVKRSIAKRLPGAPHEVLLVLDATTGQNAISQARLFHEALGVTGIALTKLDGTAKGGIVVAICQTLNLPLRYVGIGESVEDLQDFDPVRFVDALFAS